MKNRMARLAEKESVRFTGKLVAIVVLLCALSLANTKAAAEAVSAGNAYCPVSGDKVDPKVTYVHEGKEYAFCCKMCIKDFKKDPEKYIVRMQAEENQTGAAPSQHGHEHGGHDHSGGGHHEQGHEAHDQGH